MEVDSSAHVEVDRLVVYDAHGSSFPFDGDLDDQYDDQEAVVAFLRRVRALMCINV